MYKSMNVVVVTYGNRWNYLSKLLAFLEKESFVNKTIVIDNACRYDVTTACKKASLQKVMVSRNDQNLGSAGGFADGIFIAQGDKEQLILLLDDDNIPLPGSINGLIFTYNKLLDQYKNEKIAVLAFRESQHSHFRIPLKPVFMHGKDFLCFNAFNAPHRYLKLIKCESILRSGPEYAAMTGGAAYSGMVFAPKVVSDIGLPNRDFILYFDDVEYSIRMLKKNYIIWLDRENLVDDVQINYSASAYETPFWGFLAADSDSKIYYNVRNRIYLDYFVDSKMSFAYITNKLIFLTVIFILSLLTFKLKRMKTMFKAYNDGKNGRLGFNNCYPL